MLTPTERPSQEEVDQAMAGLYGVTPEQFGESRLYLAVLLNSIAIRDFDIGSRAMAEFRKRRPGWERNAPRYEPAIA